MGDRFSSTALIRSVVSLFRIDRIRYAIVPVNRYNRPYQSYGRRGFLKTLTTLGVSASTASVLTQDAVADVIDDPKREVPRIRAFRHTNHQEVVEEGAKPEREPDIYSIPRWRWARVEAAHDARRQVEKQLDGNYPVWVTDDSNGEKKIVVEQFDDGNLRSADVQALDKQVPSSVKGVAGQGSMFGSLSRFTQEHDIPVTIERTKIDPQDTFTNEFSANISTSTTITSDLGDHFTYDYDSIPAGAGMWAADSDCHPWAPLTTGFPVSHNGTKKMLTAGHGMNNSTIDRCWVDNKVSSTEDEDLLEDKVVLDWMDGGSWDPLDASRLNLGAGANSVTYDFADHSGGYEGISIWGGTSWDRIKDLQDGGPGQYGTIYQQGMTTGRDECSITYVNGRSFKTDLLGETDVKNGDSGGPIAEVRDEPWFGFRYAYGAGLVSSRNPNGDSYVFASGIPAIEQALRVTV